MNAARMSHGRRINVLWSPFRRALDLHLSSLRSLQINVTAGLGMAYTHTLFVRASYTCLCFTVLALSYMYDTDIPNNGLCLRLCSILICIFYKYICFGFFTHVFQLYMRCINDYSVMCVLLCTILALHMLPPLKSSIFFTRLKHNTQYAYIGYNM